LSELLYAASLVGDLVQLLRLVTLLGTVRGDIHDIGKNIFKMLADSARFDVHDLGVDVGPTAFVDEIKKSSPEVLGLSWRTSTRM
jgi:methanogenic corrinoid protein MtbC1